MGSEKGKLQIRGGEADTETAGTIISETNAGRLEESAE